MPKRLNVTRPIDFIEFQKASISQCIHQRIEEQVRLYPDKIALKTRDTAHTYTELNGYANCVAEALLTVCGKELAQAAILLPNTPEMIISMLGSLKARKAYVPLDHNYPVERLRSMFEDANASVLLTDDQHLGLAEELAKKHVPIINTSRIEFHAGAPTPEVGCDALDRAYILYTSGSTGRPKGIVFLHRNLLHTTMCLTNELFFAPSDRVTWLHSPSFGSSVVDIYCCLTNGATLYPWDPKAKGFSGMPEWMVEEQLTTFQWIPSAFRHFMQTVPDALVFQDIRIVIMGGESLTIREVELFRQHFRVGSHLVNQVGTGESYNYHLYRVDHQIEIEDAAVAGGYPVSPDRKVLILDEEHHQVPQGCVGEIAIKSDYMSGGYWRDEALTQKKFIRTGGDDVPVYLTGDLGKIEQDGCLIHLGRTDFQLKIRGCRIEPLEIELVLAGVPGVADCTCWIAKNRLGEDQLVGYIVLRTPGDFKQREIEETLEARLPSYMVPRVYVILDRIPSLPNGKADRNALPNPFGPAEMPMHSAASRVAPVEQTAQALFRELLQFDHVDADTDFLKAGGDSLSTVVLLHRIRQIFGIEIPIADFLQVPTPAHLAGLVMEKNASLSVSGSNHEFMRPDSFERTERAKSAIPSVKGEIQKSDESETSRKTSFAGAASSIRKNLLIIGAGQCGREVFTWASQAIAAGSPWQIKGFLDDRGNALEGYEYEPRILGSVATYEIKEDDVFVCAIGSPQSKVKCCLPIINKGGQFVNLIHPLANIGRNVELGSDVIMGPFSSITSDVKVGHHVSIGALSNVAHDTAIGDWCQISSHCGVNGCATLEEGVFLGSHACILPGVKVGRWSFVGAGSVVLRNVAPYVKMFGNPATPIGKVEELTSDQVNTCLVHPI